MTRHSPFYRFICLLLVGLLIWHSPPKAHAAALPASAEEQMSELLQDFPQARVMHKEDHDWIPDSAQAAVALHFNSIEEAEAAMRTHKTLSKAVLISANDIEEQVTDHDVYNFSEDDSPDTLPFETQNRALETHKKASKTEAKKNESPNIRISARDVIDSGGGSNSIDDVIIFILLISLFLAYFALIGTYEIMRMVANKEFENLGLWLETAVSAQLLNLSSDSKYVASSEREAKPNFSEPDPSVEGNMQLAQFYLGLQNRQNHNRVGMAAEVGNFNFSKLEYGKEPVYHSGQMWLVGMAYQNIFRLHVLVGSTNNPAIQNLSKINIGVGGALYSKQGRGLTLAVDLFAFSAQIAPLSGVLSKNKDNDNLLTNAGYSISLGMRY